MDLDGFGWNQGCTWRLKGECLSCGWAIEADGKPLKLVGRKTIDKEHRVQTPLSRFVDEEDRADLSSTAVTCVRPPLKVLDGI